MSQTNFPKIQTLRNGAILVSIARAVWLVDHKNETLSWDGSNYSINDEEGTRGTITFSKDLVVRAFRDDNSPRTPWRSKKLVDAMSYFQGAPANILDLAKKQTIQYLVDDYEGQTQPIITAAFWSDGDHLTASEPWEEVVKNGAHIIETELMESEEALKKIKADYAFSDEQVGLIKSLYERQIQSTGSQIQLTEEEKGQFVSNKGSIQLLTSIGFTFELKQL